MRPTRDQLVLPAAAFAGGIFCAHALRPDLQVLVLASAILGLLWFAARNRSFPVRHFAAAACFCALGAACAQWQHPLADPELDASSDEIVLLSGCIVEPVARDVVQARLVLELEPGARARVTITAREGEQLPALAYGEIVEIQARVRTPRNYGNPGAFDYVDYLRRHQIFWTASARGIANVRRTGQPCGSAMQSWALRIREELSQRATRIGGDDEGIRDLLPALLVGDSSHLDRAATDQFRRTGTYHALVVSGLHIAVVAGVALALFRLVGIPLPLALGAAAALAWSYAAVVNWQTPVLRSAAAFTLVLFTSWMFRRTSVLNQLALFALGALAFHPSWLFDPSFQLTVLSVASIGGLAGPLIERWLTPLSRGMRAPDDKGRDLYLPGSITQLRIELRLLSETLALYTPLPALLSLRAIAGAGLIAAKTVELATISACAQIALLAPMLYMFHAASMTGTLANLSVVPALTIAVPVGLAAAATGWPVLAEITRSLVGFARTTNDYWAGMETVGRVPDPPILLAILAVALTIALGISLVLHLRARWVLLTGSLTLMLSAGAVWIPFAPDLRLAELELTAIDVGQGDSLLVAFPEGKTMLVDSGGFASFDKRVKSRMDVGEDVVSPYLWRRGLRRLDTVVISHLHEDHAGGMARVIRNFQPAELWLGVPGSGPAWPDIERAARESNTRIVLLREGDTRRYGPASLKVLAPSLDYVPSSTPHNSDSLVLLLTNGRHHFLLTGDAERSTEQQIAGTETLPPVDVLKVAHHGSRTSSTPELLAAAQPLFALISAGHDNPYGHPHPLVMDNLQSAGCRTSRTDVDGLVTFRSDGKRLTVNTFADEQAAR